LEAFETGRRNSDQTVELIKIHDSSLYRRVNRYPPVGVLVGVLLLLSIPMFHSIRTVNRDRDPGQGALYPSGQVLDAGAEGV